MSETDTGAATPGPETAPPLADPTPAKASPTSSSIDLQPELVLAEPSAADRAAQGWLQDRIANGPIARDEAAWVHLLGALPDLIARLGALQA